MRTIALQVFRRITHTTDGLRLDQSWADWSRPFTSHDVRPEKDGPCFVAGPLRAGGARGNDAMERVDVLVLDLDHGNADAQAAALAPLMPYEWIAWTTHRHTTDAPRVRVVLPLAAPLVPAAHAAAWAGLQRLVGGANDPRTPDVGHAFYFPSTPDPAVAWTLRNTGRWLDAARDLPTAAPGADGAGDTDRVRKAQAALRAVRSTDALRPAALALLEGRALAEVGARQETLRDLTWWLAGKWRDLPLSVVERLFAPSLAAAGPGAPTVADAWAAYTRATRKLDDTDRAKAEATRQALDRAQLGAAGAVAYTPEELTTIARAQGWGDNAAVLDRRWLVQKGSNVYVLRGEGTYAGPFTRDETPTAIVTLLARSPVQLFEATRAGVRARSVADILRQHGSVAVEVVADLTRRKTTFDPSALTIYEAVRPMRSDLTPAEDAGVAAWLAALAGPDALPRLLDWVACAPDCSRPLCALYLAGDRGTGKTMLAQGLARVWHDGPPAELDRILGDFNEDLTALCPLVLADEQLPRVWKGRPISAVLRSLIGNYARTLSRKHLAPAKLMGSLRLVLAANTEHLLDSREVATSEDLEALAQRFLLITARREAAEMIAELPRETMQAWVEGGAIARHALWLYHNRAVQRGGRFWVEGETGRMHRLLMTGAKWTSAVCEWLVRYLLAPNAFDARGCGLIRRVETEPRDARSLVRAGELLVNDDAIIQGWGLYVEHLGLVPETRNVGTALRVISSPERRQLRWAGRPVRYRLIDTEHLLAWAEEHGIGDAETLRAAIGLASPPGGEGIADDLAGVPAAGRA